jgi:uncharacterized protein (TIGR03032 family)
VEKNGGVNQEIQMTPKRSPQVFWREQNLAWRDPLQVTAQWMPTTHIDPVIFKYREYGEFFSILDAFQITLLVTREYEHLVMAITTSNRSPVFSYIPLPHPSGLAIDINLEVVYIASTRNPNIIFEFKPTKGTIQRLDVKSDPLDGLYRKTLMPYRSRYLAGCFYLHDLAMVDGFLYANSVGQNAIVRLGNDAKIVWWPRCIEQGNQPVFGQNHIQLNSIAAGAKLDSSFFSASTSKISTRRPGHRNFPVDKRGVIFSGKTREPFVFGLTRPHSARLYEKQLYVDNSGYGEFMLIHGSEPIMISKLPGWTRGLGFCKDIAFVGTSRVLPRFHHYAPGLDPDKSFCGIHAVDIKTGSVLGSLIWPYGNQLFAVEIVPQKMTYGFPTIIGRKDQLDENRKLYYTFSV